MEFKELKNLLQYEEKKLFKKADKLLRSKGYNTVRGDDFSYLYAEGSIPVLLVAHTDTVHRKTPGDVFFDPKKKVMWSPDGLGADDRAGVFAVLDIAKQYDIGVLLCTDEECGALGAWKFTEDFRVNPGYRMIIELDRCGDMDCVFYDNIAYDFHKYIEGFGFVKSVGSFSDISVIAPAWRVNAVNLSVGYEDEHMKTEHLYLEPLRNTINKVKQMLSNEIPKFDYKERTRYASVKYGRGYNNSRGYNWNDFEEDEYYSDYCDVCGKFALEQEMEHVETELLCPECVKVLCSKCEVCEFYFTKTARVGDGTGSLICPECWDDLIYEQSNLTSDKESDIIGENRSDKDEGDRNGGGWKESDEA